MNFIAGVFSYLCRVKINIMIRIKLFTLCVLLANTCFIHSQSLLVQVKPMNAKFWGYATPSGEMIIPAQYEKCYPFSSNGLAVIYDGKARQYHFISVKNERLQTDPAKFKIKDGLGFNVSTFQDKLFLVEVNGLWGYMNDAGKMAIPAAYDNGSDFNGGFATVRKTGKFFVIDTKGNETPVEGEVLDVKEFSEGLAPVKMADKKFGFIDTKGKVVVPAQFETVGYFSNGLAWAKTMDKQLGYIDKTGQWVVKPEFEAGKDFDKTSGLARVKKADQWGYVNKSGKILYMNDVTSWGDFSEGLADGKKGGLVGFFNNEGKWVIEPKFQAVREFHNGYAAAKLNDKWGLIDKTGKWAIEPQYDSIKDVSLVK